MSETNKLKLKKVTPRALKVYKKHGLLDFSSDEKVIAEKTMDVFMDTKTLSEIISVSFEKKFEESQLEEIDLALIAEGVQDFLGQLSSRLRT